ncbi:MAG: MucBP domain-containing protein, partial [Pseudoflavonifractor sp.]
GTFSAPPVLPSYNYYHVTVSYLADTGEALAPSYSSRSAAEGSPYDVTPQTARVIEGYTIDHVDGDATGVLDGNKM